MNLDTHDRHLLRRVSARWPHLRIRVNRALSGGPGCEQALRQTAVAVLHADVTGFSGRDLIRLAKWEYAR